MASIDSRGFKYALAPLQQRRQWQLDKAMAAMTRLRSQVADLRGESQSLEHEAHAQAAMAGNDWQLRRDTATQSRLLAYLLGLQKQKAELDLRIVQVQGELELAQREVVRRQRGVEALAEHRNDELKVFRIEAERKITAQADDDWLARSNASAGAAP